MPDRTVREGGIWALVLWLEASGVEVLHASANPTTDSFDSVRLRFRSTERFAQDAVRMALDLGMEPLAPELVSADATDQNLWQLDVRKRKEPARPA